MSTDKEKEEKIQKQLEILSSCVEDENSGKLDIIALLDKEHRKAKNNE